MHLWLDEKTGLPLGAAKFLPSGQMVQQWLSVEFQLQKEMNPDLFALPPSNALSDDAHDGHIDANAPWRITWQPDGFVLVKNRRLGPMPASIWHWLYTDGLNAYSVFIDEAPKSKKMVLGQAFDSEHLIFEKTTQEYRLTIIGAVPKVVAEKIANSVIRETTPQP
ncbi:MAG: hypothetical protein D6706_14840 [Chloroflexi bacterium]|nr:MAG: hypothetical protein D6706_14840 [Chloroflexota bacterium]